MLPIDFFGSTSTSGGDIHISGHAVQYSVWVSAKWSLPKALYIFARYYGLLHVGFVTLASPDTWTDHDLLLFSVISISMFSSYRSSTQPYLSHKIAVGTQVGLPVNVGGQSSFVSDPYPCITNEGPGVSSSPEFQGRLWKCHAGVESIYIYRPCKAFPPATFDHAQQICASVGLVIFTTVINVILLLRIYALYEARVRGVCCSCKMWNLVRSIFLVLWFLISVVFGMLSYQFTKLLVTICIIYSRVCGELLQFFDGIDLSKRYFCW